jgi:hypothetical protein
VTTPTRPSKGTNVPGALYVHLQSEGGVEHRTIVLSPRKVRLLQVVWSRWGVALALAIAGSWVYFASAGARIPILRQRIAELESRALTIDTLQARLQALQERYDQVQIMLGVTPPNGGPPDTSAAADRRP